MPSSDWERCNKTELYQTCRAAGLNVHPTDTNERFIQLLEGTEEDPPVAHPIDPWRDAIMNFVIDYWPKLQSQITCPAKSRDPHACYGCVDQQVISCIVKNEPVLQYIQIRRKP